MGAEGLMWALCGKNNVVILKAGQRQPTGKCAVWGPDYLEVILTAIAPPIILFVMGIGIARAIRFFAHAANAN
jgi:hypothetical protein